MSEDLSRKLAHLLLHVVVNAREAQAVYRQARAAGIGEDVARKVRAGDSSA